MVLEPVSNIPAQLMRFRAAHPTSKTYVEGIEWEYIACGHGSEALVILPGAPGRAETAFQYILAFEHDYRVLSMGYPPEPHSVAQLVRGLAGVMSAEHVATAHFLGGSYSGLLVQSFVRAYPEMVDRLVLSDTGVPRKSRARQYSRYLRILNVLPLFAIHALWRLGAILYLREIDVDRDFWRGYFTQLIPGITRQECIGRLKIWIDFDRNSHFTRHDLANWPGQLLLLSAEQDSTFPQRERAALSRLYPQARDIVFSGGNHATSIVRREEYIAAIADFFGVTLTRSSAE